MGLSQDAEYVLQAYRTHFLGRENIVLYGVGTNTKAILSELQDPNIIGLMDPLCEGSVVMGKPVLTPQEAAARAGLIVIVARPSVVPIIFERIRDLESTFHVPIFNIEGRRLAEEEEAPWSSELPYWSCSGEELRRQIASAEVISFDVFDTLLVRDVLRPVDLFFFLERGLRRAGIPCPDFAMRRQAAEAALNQVCVPNLDQIYTRLGKDYGWKEEIISKACALEFAFERRACHARKYMRDIYRWALELHKTVVLVSDMYLPQAQLQTLLENAGYTGYHGLYISCERQATKASGALFALVRRDFSGTILHIGDNAQADDTQARAHGLRAYPILSAYDMLIHSSMGKLAAKARTPDMMLILGMVIRRLFDDPFALGPTKGMVPVDDLFLLGCALIGPVISCFVRWMCREAWDKNSDMILFCARDGYLIEKLYRRRWAHAREHLPKGVYFKTSRRAMTVAALKNKDDISEIMQKPYKTLKGQLLTVRFGVDAAPMDAESMDSAISTQNAEEVERYIFKYAVEILRNAASERKNYLSYMDKIGLTGTHRILLYDFCSSGTIQHSLSKVIGPSIQICGIYFATMDWLSKPYHKDYSAHALFGNITQYFSPFFTTKNYMFLEAILLDHCNTCLHCNADGTFAYAHEENTARNIQKLSKIQSGILIFDSGVRRWEDVLNFIREADRDFADEILGTLFNGRCRISREVQGCVSVDNEYDFQRPYQIQM